MKDFQIEVSVSTEAVKNVEIVQTGKSTFKVKVLTPKFESNVSKLMSALEQLLEIADVRLKYRHEKA